MKEEDKKQLEERIEFWIRRLKATQSFIERKKSMDILEDLSKSYYELTGRYYIAKSARELNPCYDENIWRGI
jgi:hypothetical protein